MPAFHSLTTTISVGGLIAYVESVNASQSKETVEVRALDLEWVERVAGLNDLGPIEVTAYAQAGAYGGFVTTMHTGVPVNCTLSTTDGASISRNVLITACNIVAEASDAVKFNMTLMGA